MDSLKCSCASSVFRLWLASFLATCQQENTSSQ